MIRSALPLLLILSFTLNAGEWSGEFALEGCYFTQNAQANEQVDSNLSISLKPEFYHAWDNGRQSLTIFSLA